MPFNCKYKKKLFARLRVRTSEFCQFGASMFIIRKFYILYTKAYYIVSNCVEKK